MLAATNANVWLGNAYAWLEEIRAQQNDHINKLLNAEKMRAKEVIQELDAVRLGKEDELQQHVTEQTKTRVPDGNR